MAQAVRNQSKPRRNHRNIRMVVVLFIFKYIVLFFFNPPPKICSLIREKGSGRVGERVTDVREKHQLVTSSTHQPGIVPATQVCILTGDPTCNLQVYRTTVQTMELPSQGWLLFFKSKVTMDVKYQVLGGSSQQQGSPSYHYIKNLYQANMMF